MGNNNNRNPFLLYELCLYYAYLKSIKIQDMGVNKLKNSPNTLTIGLSPTNRENCLKSIVFVLINV